MAEYFYKVHGLSIKSSIYFPELIISNPFFDIEIYFDNDLNSFSLNCFEESYYGDLLKIQYNEKESIVFFEDQAVLKISNGKEIVVYPETSLNLSFLRALILSQGIGTLLQQRGYLVLHGNCVKMDNGAVIFIGSSGNGKSTTSIALNNTGYPFVADDVLAVKFENNNFIVLPSFPRVKLWDDIINQLTDSHPNSKYVIHPSSKKFSYSTEKNFYHHSLPLKKIYVIEKGEKNEIINLSLQEALINLVKNSYNVKMFNNSEKEINLLQCANIIENVPVDILKTEQSIESIKELVKLIEEDIFIKDINYYKHPCNSA